MGSGREVGDGGFGIFTESNMKSGAWDVPLLGFVPEVHTGSFKGSSESAKFFMGSESESGSVFERSGLSGCYGPGVGFKSASASCFLPKRLFFFPSIML